jgi:hypothetical protein
MKGEELEQRKKTLYATTEQYKEEWDRGGIIQFKNERKAIFHRRIGTKFGFVIACDDVTKDGFEVRVIDGLKLAAGENFEGCISPFCCFQRGV